MNEEKTAPKLTNVFVLMLENHSFDTSSRCPASRGLQPRRSRTSISWKEEIFCAGRRAMVHDD